MTADVITFHDETDNKADVKRLGYVGSTPGAKRDSDSWYTPDVYLDSARRALEGIDFDPFSSVAANERVKASLFYTEEDDALTRQWPTVDGVWMNPPYSNGLCGKAVTAFLEEWKAGTFKRGIVLVNNATDTIWWDDLMREATAVCFTDHRIAFWNEDGKASSGNTRGQAFVYFGKQTGRFVREFDRHGTCMVISKRVAASRRDRDGRK